MSTWAVVTFPYSGFESNDQRERVFWQVIDCATERTTHQPVVVLNRDTHLRKGPKNADAFFRNLRHKELEIHEVWSVDTCQMWLSGWGKILDEKGVHDEDRIVLLPGDLDFVSFDDDSHTFIANLKVFIGQGLGDLTIGDFASGDPFNAKELIDLYGTYPLMANWFPKVAQKIRELPLHKPRSEFVNVKVKVLRELLDHRKFAYEQTLNMLIRSLDTDSKKPRYDVTAANLGKVKDDGSLRQYIGCLDQIDRTERMLRLLWREIHGAWLEDDDPEKRQKFIDDYDALDRRSTSIRDNARIIIKNFLEQKKARTT
jgi:hypothetical protein